MKLLVLLFLVGCASSASFYDALDDAAEHELISSLDNGLYLKETLELVDDQLFTDRESSDMLDELKKRLRDGIERFLESLSKYIGGGEGRFNEKWKEQIDMYIQKLHDYKIKVNEKIINILKEIRDKVPKEYKEFFDKIIKKLEDIKEEKEFDEAQHDFNLKPLCQKLKDAVLKFDKEKIPQKIDEIFGKDSMIGKSIKNFLKKYEEHGDKWKQKLLDMLDRCIGKEKRSLKDYWEKVKNYLKDLHIDLKEKYMKFGEWIKEQFEKGLQKGKDKFENIKAIAKELIDHGKGLSKELKEQALEALKEYKDILGDMYEQLKKALQDKQDE